MTVKEAEMYFGTLYRVCKNLGIAPQNMTKWKAQGYIPLLQQYRIAELTDGKLMPDEHDPREVNRKKRYLPKNPKESRAL